MKGFSETCLGDVLARRQVLAGVELNSTLSEQYWSTRDTYKSQFRARGVERPSIDWQTDRDCEDELKEFPYQKMGHFRFAHAETLAPALAWLDLFHTPRSQMLYNTPPSVRSTRAWRTSDIVTFSSNLMFLAYSCEDGLKPKSSSGLNESRDVKAGKALLKVLHNEKEVVLPSCGELYCDYSLFLHLFEEKLDVDFGETCHIMPNYYI